MNLKINLECISGEMSISYDHLFYFEWERQINVI